MSCNCVPGGILYPISSIIKCAKSSILLCNKNEEGCMRNEKGIVKDHMSYLFGVPPMQTNCN